MDEDFKNREQNIRSMTLSDLAAATQGLQISRMIIRGDIPPNLHHMVPHLIVLKLMDTPNIDKLQR